METKSTCNHKLQTFVQFRCQLKQVLIEFFKSESISLGVKNHGDLLLVEERPYLIYLF